MDLYELSELMSEINQSIEGIILLGFLILGFLAVLQCFFGYKLIRIWIALIGGMVGALVGLIIGALSGAELVAALCVLMCMILGGILAYKVYMIGIFCVGLIGGALVGAGLGILLGMGTGSIALAFIVGILGGVGSIILAKPVIILLTAIPAAIQLAGIIGVLFEDGGIGVFFGLAFGIGGTWFQFKDNKKVEKSAETPELSQSKVETTSSQTGSGTNQSATAQTESGINQSVSGQTESGTNQSASSQAKPIYRTFRQVEPDADQTAFTQIAASIEGAYVGESQQYKPRDFILEKTGKTKEEWMKILKQKSINILKKLMQYIKCGKEKGKEGCKQLIIRLQPLKEQLIVQVKKAWEILQRPEVRKKCLVSLGVLAGILIVIMAGKWLYNDSLRYRIPEESKLQAFANLEREDDLRYRGILELQSVHKKNRKAYDVTLEGQYEKGLILMLGTFESQYTYDGKEWHMSAPKLVKSDEIEILKQVNESEVYAYLMSQINLNEDHDDSTPVMIQSENIVVQSGSTAYESIYEYTFQVAEGVLGYQVTGTIGYQINSEGMWEVKHDTFTYAIQQSNVEIKPDEAQFAQILSMQGVDIEGYGKVYYGEEMLKVKLKDFKQDQTNWLATFEVTAKAPYLSGSFEVSAPYSVKDRELYVQNTQDIKTNRIQFNEAGSKLPSLNQEALKEIWKENNRIRIYNEENQETVDYTIDENAQITIGPKFSVDLRNENEKLIIGYTLKVVTSQHELSCQMNIPYKEVFDEMLEQLRLITYANNVVTIYPITQERIQEDLKNIYLNMESSTQVVQRYTGENIQKLEILNKSIEEDQETYNVMVKFNIEENNQLVTYVGEYNMTYQKHPFNYSLSNIQFVE